MISCGFCRVKHDEIKQPEKGSHGKGASLWCFSRKMEKLTKPFELWEVQPHFLLELGSHLFINATSSFNGRFVFVAKLCMFYQCLKSCFGNVQRKIPANRPS